MSVVLVSEKSWDVSAADELDAIIDDADKDLVTEEHLNSIQPRYVFSSLVPLYSHQCL